MNILLVANVVVDYLATRNATHCSVKCSPAVAVAVIRRICYDRRVHLARDYLLMKAIELIGAIDDEHRLHAQVPESFRAGPVRVIGLAPSEDDAGSLWAPGIAAEWSDELRDPRQDIYTLDDGRPVNEPR